MKISATTLQRETTLNRKFVEIGLHNWYLWFAFGCTAFQDHFTNFELYLSVGRQTWVFWVKHLTTYYQKNGFLYMCDPSDHSYLKRQSQKEAFCYRKKFLGCCCFCFFSAQLNLGHIRWACSLGRPPLSTCLSTISTMDSSAAYSLITRESYK